MQTRINRNILFLVIYKYQNFFIFKEGKVNSFPSLILLINDFLYFFNSVKE